MKLLCLLMQSFPGTLALTTRHLMQGRRVIRSYMPQQHQDFFSGLQMLLVGLEDRGMPLAQMFVGRCRIHQQFHSHADVHQALTPPGIQAANDPPSCLVLRRTWVTFISSYEAQTWGATVV